jgi:hypothetical protein
MKFIFPFSVSILLSLLIGMLNQSEKTLSITDETQLSAPHAVNDTRGTAPAPFINPPNAHTQLTQGTAALLVPIITATKTDQLITDNGTSGATPTDVIEYTVTIANTGVGAANDATGVIFTDTVDPNTTLVPGSVKSAPIAVRDAYSTVGNVSISVPAASGLTSNDVNLDGDVLTITAVDQTGTEGQVTFNAADGSFTFNPNPGFTGTTTFTYTVNDGTFNSTGTVTITITGMIWFINSSAPGGGDGRLNTPFNSMNAFNGSSLDEPGDNIFVYSGTYTNTLSTLLLGQQKLIGQGAVGTSLAALAGVTFSVHPPISPATIPAVNGTRPQINQAANNIDMQSENQLRGVNITNTGGTALIGSGFTSALVREVTVKTTGGAAAVYFNTGALDAIFTEISASNATYGIRLASVTGTFTVTGTSTTDGTGGVLSNISTRGIEIIGTSPTVSLSNMTLTGANTTDGGGAGVCDEVNNINCNAAIFLQNISAVGSVTLTNVDITTTEEHGINANNINNLVLSNCTSTSNGNNLEENALKLRNVFGTCSISNCSFTLSAYRIFHLINTSGSLTLTVTNTTFNNTITNTPGIGQDCFEARTQGNATATINLTNSNFQRARTKGIQAVAEGTSTLNLNVNGCAIQRFAGLMAGIEASSGEDATMNHNITNCTAIEAANEVAVLSTTGANSKFNGRVNSNVITQDPAANFSADVVRMMNDVTTGQSRVEIKNNTITTANSVLAAIIAWARSSGAAGPTLSTSRLDATIDNNTINTDADLFQGIVVQSAATSTDVFQGTACGNVLNNDIVGSPFDAADYLEASASAVLLMQGAGAGATESARALANWAGNLNTPPAGPVFATATGSVTYNSTCLTPAHATARIAAEPLTIIEKNSPEDAVAQVQEESKSEPDTQKTIPGPSKETNELEEAARRAVVLSGETVTVGGMGGFLLPAGQNIIIKFQVTINNSLPLGTCQVSNQGTVTGSNFSTLLTDDTALPGATDPTTTTLSTHTLGNLVFKDNNKNGVFDGGDAGIAGVTVNLYNDVNDNNVLDAGDAFVTTTTTVAGGLYTFPNLCSGNYIVQIPSTEFGSGQELNGLISSPGGTASDPDNNTDNDDNGQDAINSSIAGQAITLDFSGATVEVNNSLDFGFRTPTTITINDVTLAEGTGGSPTAFNFTVNRSDNSEAFSLTVNTTAGSATSGTDYSAISAGTVSFTAGGSLTATVTVNVTHDNIVEANETFNVVLSGAPDGVIFTDDTGAGTINNDDNATVTLTGGSAQNEGNAGTTSYTFTATLNNDVQGGFSVAYSTNDGTATTADNDYQDNDGPALVFTGTAGETKTITILVNGDTKVEANETFSVALGSVSGVPVAGTVTTTSSPQTATITNDDNATVTLTGGIARNEGNAGTTSYTFIATLDNAVQGGFSVAYATSDGTATTADGDYQDNDGPALAFTGTAGETQTITVLVNGDIKVETNETFSVALGNVSGIPIAGTVTTAGSPQTATINNDDNATVTLTGGIAQNEGNSGTTSYTFTAILNNAVQGGFTVAYATSDGTATTADGDYQDNDGPALAFTGTAGETKTITVAVNGDLNIEANETFTVELGSITGAPAGVIVAGTAQTGTITNDEQDWGDAPTTAQSGFAGTYPTLSANNGARHAAAPGGLRLGATLDADLDGQPNLTASGDGADEDGVTLPGALIVNNSASVTVNASAISKLDAWVDFNRDGDWGDAGEQIFTNTSLVAGNNNLTFNVPAGASLGTSFARFRVSTAGGLAFTGLANDGEVEDYQVSILDNQFTIDSPTVSEGNAGTVNLNFTIARTTNSGASSVNYAITGGTAGSPGDYAPLASGMISFTDGGALSQTVTVVVNGDNIVEDNETVLITLSNPVNGGIGGTGIGTGTINNDDAATVTLTGGIAQSEGNSGTTSYTFTATLNNDVQGGFSVAYTTSDGTATTADNDYTDNDGPALAFTGTAGETKTITVLVNGDTKVEANETFTVALGSITGAPAGVTVAGLAQTGTITNDDNAIVTLTGGSAQSEGNAGTTSYTFTATLNNPVQGGFSVAYTTNDGTATSADNDYIDNDGPALAFTGTAGETKIITILVNSDIKVETNETFSVALGSVSGAPIAGTVTTAGSPQTATINNDDNATVTLSAAASPLQHPEGNTATTGFTFSVTLNNPVQGGFTLPYTTSDGLATTADGDYIDNDGLLTFAGTTGETQTITVLANGDLKVEANEDFSVALGSISGAPAGVTTAGSPLQGLIVNDELDWGDAPDSYNTLSANNGARHNTSIAFHLGATVDGDLDGQPTGTANGDDTDAEGNDDDGVTLPAVLVTSTTANITVNASGAGFLNAWVDFNNDGDWGDPGEQIFTNTALVTGDNALSFAVPAGATPANTFARFRYTTTSVITPAFTGLQTTGEVEDYAIQIVNTQFSIDDVAIAEGNAGTTNLTFTISRTVNANACSVNYAITGGSAASGSDYQTFTNGTAGFTAGGVLSQTVTVVLNGDQTVELDETILMTLSNPVNGSILDGSGTGTIQNDDAATITVSNPSVVEGTFGTAAMIFDLTLSHPSDANVAVNYATVDGTATTADNDYQSASGIHTFTPGQTTKQVSVTVNGDCKAEANETLLLRLSSLQNNGRNVTLSGGGATLDGTGTIQNTALPTATIGGTTAVCQNSPQPNITFTGSGGTAPYTFTYKINGGPDLVITTSAMTNTVTVAHPTAMTGVFNYTLVSISDSYCGQSQSGTATVTVNAPPVVSIPQNSLCTGLTMTLSPTSGGTWISSNPSIATITNQGLVTGLAAGVVNFTFTQTSTGCSSTTSNVTVKPTPSSNLTAGKVDVCPNTEVALNPNCSIPNATVNWNPGGPTVTPDAATLPYIYKASCTADGCTGNESSVEVRTHRILVDMKDLDVGTLPLPIVRAVKDNMAPTNLIEAPVFPRRWTFIAQGCDASESAVFKLSGPVNFSTVDNAGTYAMFANDEGGFYSLDHPNYGNGGSFPNGTYTLTIELRDRDGVGGPFPKNRVATGSLLATRTLQFTVIGPPSIVGNRQGLNSSEVFLLDASAFAEISPNPVTNTMRLKLSGHKGKQVQVNLIDASGRHLLQRSFLPQTNSHQEEFDVSRLANGVYFLKVNADDKQATLKVIKVE